jgi:catechol 2,3-dioxygenase-like lactoylglutathione lyase family enzyme
MNRTTASHDLANLKKRAKRLVREHRERYVPVAERLRQWLPIFAGKSDRAVLDAPFALHQAQELIARELGFEGWTQLKETIEMSSTRSTTQAGRPPAFRIAHPQVFVTDMERAIRFYRDSLGFEVGFTYGDPPFYGLMQRGEAVFNLRHVDMLPWDDDMRRREDLLALTIQTSGLKELFVAWKEAGVPMHQPLKEQPWGRDFIVRDPDGNLLGFGDLPDPE